jgi:hypothetical protein
MIPLEKIGRGVKAMDEPLSIGCETGYLDLNRSGMAAGSGNRGGEGRYHGGPPGGGRDLEQSANGQQRPNLNELATPSRMWIKKVVLHHGE